MRVQRVGGHERRNVLDVLILQIELDRPSVIALAKPENRREQIKTDERICKR